MNIDRRTMMIAGLSATTATATALASPSPDKGSRMTPSSIDTHQHFLPKVYVDAVGLDALAAVMPNRMAPAWSVELALAMMDENGIGEGIISISSGPHIANAPVLLRKCNDEAASIRAKHPGRFGSFASLPLPDVDASLKEIAYALDVLKADGFIIFTNYDGKYLGDPHFAPVLAELNRRKAIAFIHPNEVPYELQGLPPQSVIEFPFDTTRTATSLIMSGAIKAYPNVKFILSHAGGTLPYLTQRLAGAVMMNPAMAEKVGDPMAAIRAFWFDTALSFSKPVMAALASVADPQRILFGTDFPMAPPLAITTNAAGLAHAPMDEGLRTDIARGNAERLLGRV